MSIVRDDIDRETFVRTLAQAAQRSGIEVHGWVLMKNHYHLLVSTPEPNLSRAMGWFQNAFTRRINTRHQFWGRLFGDRYKSILVEPGEAFAAVLDYIHLNPVRAGLIGNSEGVDSYRWSSLPDYLKPISKRPKWAMVERGLSTNECVDTAKGRKEFLHLLERKVDWTNPMKAGLTQGEGRGRPDLSLRSSLRRGWFFGSEAFRERLLGLAGGLMEEKLQKRADGYAGESGLLDYGEDKARRILAAGLREQGLERNLLDAMPKRDPRKVLIADLLQAHTTVKLDWIRSELHMGDRSGCCRRIKEFRAGKNAKLEQIQKAILKKAIIHD